MLAPWVKDRPRQLIGAAFVAACCVLALAVGAADRAGGVAPGIDAEKFFSALVKVRAHALSEARSAETLGTDREGTGIVIDDKGLILTIGYLIVEADQVEVVDDQGQTLPARVVGYDHSSGLGLVRPLILRDATETDPHLPGNLFVPIDLLKPILPELIRTGRRSGPVRPWLGVVANEVQGRLIGARVSPDGPGEQAGLKAGDIILAVGDEAVRSQAEFYRKIWGRGAAGSDIPLRLLQDIDVHDINVHSIDRLDYFRQKTSY